MHEKFMFFPVNDYSKQQEKKKKMEKNEHNFQLLGGSFHCIFIQGRNLSSRIIISNK